MFAGTHGNESFALGCDDMQIPAKRLGNLNKAVYEVIQLHQSKQKHSEMFYPTYF